MPPTVSRCLASACTLSLLTGKRPRFRSKLLSEVFLHPWWDVTRRCPFPVPSANLSCLLRHRSGATSLEMFFNTRSEWHVPCPFSKRVPCWVTSVTDRTACMRQGFSITVSPASAHSRCSVHIYPMRRKSYHLGYDYLNTVCSVRNIRGRGKKKTSCKRSHLPVLKDLWGAGPSMFESFPHIRGTCRETFEGPLSGQGFSEAWEGSSEAWGGSSEVWQDPAARHPLLAEFLLKSEPWALN